MQNKFKVWLDNATGDEIDALAHHACVAPAYIRHVALGRRNASAELAGRIEAGLKKMGYESITRADLNSACRECPYFKACPK